MARTTYTEPADFIPEEIRKKLKLGEYNDDIPDREVDEKAKNNQQFRDYINRRD